MSTDSFTDEDFMRAQKEYWRQVSKSDGFDIENVTIPSSMNGMITGMIPYDCKHDIDYPYPVLVKRYAKLGLHRYNLLRGTNLKLVTLIKLNMVSNCVSSYYMTLLAQDELFAQDEAVGQATFQVRVDEKRFGRLDLTVSIARSRPNDENKDEVTTTNKPFVPHFHYDAGEDSIFKGALPEWPSDDTLNGGTKFYMVSSPFVHDCFSLYLELVICAHDRYISETVLSQLQIVRVALATPDVHWRDNETNWLRSEEVYITFKGLANAQAPGQVFEIGEHVERNAIVRRVLNLETGYMTLLGLGTISNFGTFYDHIRQRQRQISAHCSNDYCRNHSKVLFHVFYQLWDPL